ncbi:hypothetical protein JAAARDRAFT_463478 [Jaapia argillacea MUCL 33604]|uniref:Uncharacterized protein n=1 Tax=Jaapia argillacea MUCL 33604 TaxID=933084 RepID=A0A067QIV2_9AGAM|nr:hypothetical protein JAAARDRAFT_463478 [Jaapia argillacea MUCL 33604]
MNSRSVASGPFAGRFSDNLRGSGSGNPTAKRTILTHSPTHNPRQEGRPNKRSKLVHDSSVPPDSFYGSSRPDAAASANHLARNPTRNTRRSSNPSTVSAGVIEVLDEEEEEEDIGVTVSRSPRLTRTHSSSSTDPMNIIEDSPIGPSQLARMDQSKSHLIDHPHNGRKAPLRTGRSGPPDGESTKRMQGRILRPPHSTPADAPEIVDDSESDHISDADNWREDEEARRTKTPTRKTTIHTGVVKDRVEKIEKLRRPPPVPHLDLRLEGQKKDQRPSLRGAMKPQVGGAFI